MSTMTLSAAVSHFTVLARAKVVESAVVGGGTFPYENVFATS